MTTAREFLAAVQQRADAATEGPWTFQHWGEQNQNGDYAESILFDGDGETSTYGLADRDGEFIAASRTDVPRLVAALTAALDLHKPVYYDGEWCSSCIDPDTVDLGGATAGAVSYPCPTVRAITAALTPKENDS